MGNAPRYWFPLALLGFAQLGFVAADLIWLRTPPWRYADYLPGAWSSGFAVYDSGASGPAYRSQLLIQTQISPLRVGFLPDLGWLVVLAVAVLGTMIWYAVTARRAGKPFRTGRFVLVTLGALLAIPLLDLAAWAQFHLSAGVRGPVLATLGLVLLAWYERSVPVLVVTAVFVLVAVVLLTDPSGILISAGALLGGAFVALLRRRPQAPATAADTP